jgi:lambda family phage minor tail protein L
MAQEDIIEVIQKLEPGAKVRLIEVDCTEFQGGILRFHNYNVPHTEAELLTAQASGMDIPAKTILWQGNEYACWPYQLEGVEMDGTGSSPSPTLTVANLDGSISSLCLQLQNLFKARVTEHLTFEQYLDGGRDADPEMEYTQTWYITRKTSENKKTVAFELSSPADLTGQKLPRRQIYSVCHWALNNGYRGPDCGWTGNVFFTDKGVPTDNPAEDSCGGLCLDCKLRFGEEAELPFGGFIASSLIT